MSREEVNQIVARNAQRQSNLIAILQDVQGKYGYLPREALETVAESTGRSLVDVYGVATFFKSFSLQPRGRHLVQVCLGTACHVRQSPLVAAEFEHQLGISGGETTSDRQFSLETVNCLGACALGPVVVVDGHYFSQVSSTRVGEILKHAADGLDKVEAATDERCFPVEVSCAHCNHSLMDPSRLIDFRPSIHITAAFGDQHGSVHLSSIYGSYKAESEFDIPSDCLVSFFCPHCNAELIGADGCPECGIRMAPMIVKGGGVVQICPRRGCKGHLLDLL